MAEKAAHVTMLQRSPTYIVSLPSEDKIANWMRRRLPDRLAYGITRWKNVLIAMSFFGLSRRAPDVMKKYIAKGVRKQLGPSFDLTHFTPHYNPWDQRLCFVPNADLFKAIRAGRASVVTDEIETFTETGLRLRSGQQLDADVVVTATGLVMRLMKGLTLVVDGKAVDLPKTMVYKGMMYSDVPNLASAIGYTNASWTLRCDLTAEYVCRLINHMDRRGAVRCTPRRDPFVKEEPVVDFNSGYVLRALDALPRRGTSGPWRMPQNYLRDIVSFRYNSVEDEAMEFERPPDGVGR
jgi:cation diffusion facilitator CzcD-associated flavoprotein CzcO